MAKEIAIGRAIGFLMDSSAGGMDWFVMFINTDCRRMAYQHVCPQGASAAIVLLSAFAADCAASSFDA